jgi:hypothetical protein
MCEWASGGSTVVDHPITHPEIEGSNPGTTHIVKKWSKVKLIVVSDSNIDTNCKYLI